jgi:hypothetical protein
MTRLGDLPQMFWRSRFDRDLEMRFALAGVAPHRDWTDWRSLYFSVKTALRYPETAPGLRNKQRIWKCLRHVGDAIEQLIVNMEPEIEKSMPSAVIYGNTVGGESLG